MPSSMIHLLTAYKYKPNANAEFWIGNIAPDSVKEWKDKDRIHFRDRDDRLIALNELASKLNLNDEYCIGILLHLFLDYHWDNEPLRNFRINNMEGDWYPKYRYEIALAGGWLYHHMNWANKVWNEMVNHTFNKFEPYLGIMEEDVREFISRNYVWHKENNDGPSIIYTPEFIDSFTSKVAFNFSQWLNGHRN